MTRNKVIAVTGGIGSGKSTVCELLSKMGCNVIDCDEIAKRISESKEVLDEICATFGEEYIVNGKLDRKKLRQRVFNDEESTEKLNKIFDKRVIEDLYNHIERSYGPVFIEVSVMKALPTEMFSDIWQVTASNDVRIRRVVFRDNVSAEDVMKIIKTQQSYNYTPTAVIDNSGFVDSLKPQLTALVEKVRNK